METNRRSVDLAKEEPASEEYSSSVAVRRSKGKLVGRYLAVIIALVLMSLATIYFILGFSTDKDSWRFPLFLAGALWIGLGALIGGGFADSGMVGRMNPAASPETGRMLAQNRIEQREHDLSSMLVMMAVGAVLFLLCFLTYP